MNNFRQADKNGDGKISVEEIFTIFKANGISCTTSEVRDAFFLTDADQSGDLDLDQFGQFCANTGTVFGTKDTDKKKSNKPSKK